MVFYSFVYVSVHRAHRTAIVRHRLRRHQIAAAVVAAHRPPRRQATAHRVEQMIRNTRNQNGREMVTNPKPNQKNTLPKNEDRIADRPLPVPIKFKIALECIRFNLPLECLCYLNTEK